MLQTLELVQAASQPPASLLFDTLSNEIDPLPGDFILVLDDYSIIRGQAVVRRDDPQINVTGCMEWAERTNLLSSRRTINIRWNFCGLLGTRDESRGGMIGTGRVKYQHDNLL
jgi:hypothetical protein